MENEKDNRAKEEGVHLHWHSLQSAGYPDHNENSELICIDIFFEQSYENSLENESEHSDNNLNTNACT